MSLPGHHPHFDDQRSAYWHTSLAEALGQAAGTGKRVFLQVGRLGCGGSRALVEKTIPKEEIAGFLAEHFVCVAVSSEDPGPEVAAILGGLPRSAPTPVCVYLDAGGRAVHSTVGGRPAAVFLRDMTEALAK